MENFITDTYVQYGFAGFAFLLAGIIFYMVKAWRSDMKEGRDDLKDVVGKNTEAFLNHKESLNGLKDTIKENTEVLRSINGKSK